MAVTNTAYAWGSMAFGDWIAAPSGYMDLIIYGVGADGQLVGEVVQNLGGPANGILDDWVSVDLSSLTGATELRFAFASDTRIYGWWLDYPVYFAFDDVVYRYQGDGDPGDDPCTHDYVAVVTAPTCTEGGYTTYTCSECGESYVDDEVAALGHDYEWVEIAPTCTEDGYWTGICSVCGDVVEADGAPALGHDYVAVVTNPTCTRGGYTKYTCSECGDSYVADKVAPLGHNWSEPFWNGEAWCVECENCGKIKYVTHDCGDGCQRFGEPVAAEVGFAKVQCLDCGEWYTYKLDFDGADVTNVYVDKLNGNQNRLWITVVEVYGGFEFPITQSFMITNNAAGTYTVGNTKVYVDTKGNTQIRECYIVP